MKERKRKITTITIIGIMLILAITTFTYAIWSRTHTQTGINKNTYACFDISYEETNGTGITMENGFPQKDEEGLKNKPYEVQITNTCDTVSTYNVILNKQQGSSLADEHLKVAVNNDYKLLSDATKIDKREIKDFTNDASYIIGTGVVGPKQTKIVQIRSWMDKDTSETDGEDKSFTFKITIENVAGDSNLLAGKILASQKVNEDIIDFTTELGDWKLDREVNIDASKGICVTEKYENIYWDNIDNLVMKRDTYKCNVTNPSQYIDYYTFGYNSDMGGTKIYRIKETSGSTITNADIQYYVLKEGEGLVKTSDDDGTTYIYRGEINNNYVSFANKLWRVVRINGDGTIRIILNDKDTGLPNMGFNSLNNAPKYAGYTYDNGKTCTNENPCDTSTGVSSTIKEALETWYQNNLQDYDNKIALTKYCNDTTTGGTDNDGIYHGAGERIRNNTATLKCSNTEKDYGGLYKLKIGLLTADEVMYGGLPYIGPWGSEYNYLYRNCTYWTMSPFSFYSSITIGLSVSSISLFTDDIDYSDAVLPVINLKSDVTVTGTGTQSEPYIVQ